MKLTKRKREKKRKPRLLKKKKVKRTKRIKRIKQHKASDRSIKQIVDVRVSGLGSSGRASGAPSIGRSRQSLADGFVRRRRGGMGPLPGAPQSTQIPTAGMSRVRSAGGLFRRNLFPRGVSTLTDQGRSGIVTGGVPGETTRRDAAATSQQRKLSLKIQNKADRYLVDLLNMGIPENSLPDRPVLLDGTTFESHSADKNAMQLWAQELLQHALQWSNNHPRTSIATAQPTVARIREITPVDWLGDPIPSQPIRQTRPTRRVLPTAESAARSTNALRAFIDRHELSPDQTAPNIPVARGRSVASPSHLHSFATSPAPFRRDNPPAHTSITDLVASAPPRTPDSPFQDTLNSLTSHTSPVDDLEASGSSFGSGQTVFATSMVEAPTQVTFDPTNWRLDDLLTDVRTPAPGVLGALNRRGKLHAQVFALRLDDAPIDRSELRDNVADMFVKFLETLMLKYWTDNSHNLAHSDPMNIMNESIAMLSQLEWLDLRAIVYDAFIRLFAFTENEPEVLPLNKFLEGFVDLFIDDITEWFTESVINGADYTVGLREFQTKIDTLLGKYLQYLDSSTAIVDFAEE